MLKLNQNHIQVEEEEEEEEEWHCNTNQTQKNKKKTKRNIKILIKDTSTKKNFWRFKNFRKECKTNKQSLTVYNYQVSISTAKED